MHPHRRKGLIRTLIFVLIAALVAVIGYVVGVTPAAGSEAAAVPAENPPGALWQIVPADQAPADAETASTGGGS